MPSIFQYSDFIQFLLERGDRQTLLAFFASLYPNAPMVDLETLIRLLTQPVGVQSV